MSEDDPNLPCALVVRSVVLMRKAGQEQSLRLHVIAFDVFDFAS